MDRKEAIWRLQDHFRVHNDGRPTPKLDEAVRIMFEALKEPERKKGQWTTELKEDSDSLLRCSVCGYPVSYFGGRTDFCPSCGADMRGEEE